MAEEICKGNVLRINKKRSRCSLYKFAGLKHTICSFDTTLRSYLSISENHVHLVIIIIYHLSY